jgi:hypothetical protein
LTGTIAVSSGPARSPGDVPVYSNPDILFMDMKRLTGARRGFPPRGNFIFPGKNEIPLSIRGIFSKKRAIFPGRNEIFRGKNEIFPGKNDYFPGGNEKSLRKNNLFPTKEDLYGLYSRQRG